MKLRPDPHAIRTYFDARKDDEFPNGTWACGVPGHEEEFGATPIQAQLAFVKKNPNVPIELTIEGKIP